MLASLVKGLAHAGVQGAAGRAPGTGAGGDPGMFRDAGATTVIDFTGFGHEPTYPHETHGSARGRSASSRRRAAACYSQWTVELLSTTAVGLLLSQSDGMSPPNDRM